MHLVDTDARLISIHTPQNSTPKLTTISVSINAHVHYIRKTIMPSL